MTESDSLRIDYRDHERVRRILDRVTYCLEGISIEFDRWDEEYVRGPGLYFAVVSGSSVADYADPMGTNRWPVEECPVVDADEDAFYAAARDVATSRDGAVVVAVDGSIHGQMVRFRDRPAADDAVTYADWMGSRHMSAADTSVREEVVATLTLSEETGRVCVFVDGEFSEQDRSTLAEGWRGED
ncbi:MAG: hypothetical protein ABEJ82_03335 [Haloplanus sp.]